MRAAPYSVVGPAICQGCRAFVWWALSRTRLQGKVVKGSPRWRDQGGRVHRCRRHFVSCARSGGGRIVSGQTKRSGGEEDETLDTGPRRRCVTADLRDTGYNSRQSQARLTAERVLPGYTGAARETRATNPIVRIRPGRREARQQRVWVFPAGVNDRGHARHEPEYPLRRAESSRSLTARTASEKGAVCLPQPSSSGIGSGR